MRSQIELDQYLALPDPTQFSYLLDADEFIIDHPITVPGSGVNGGLTFFGLGNNFTTIKTVTPGIAMFEGGGNLFLNDMVVSAEGVGSSVFGMTSSTGFEAVEMVNINFQNCESLGFLDGFRQGLLINGFMIGDKQGLEFRGTWSGGFRITDSRFIFTPAVGSYMFKSEVSHSFGSRFGSNANSTIGAGSIGYDFRPDSFVNDANFQLLGSQNNGSGITVNGITASDKKSLWRDNVGVDDTFQGIWIKNTASTITDIVTTGVYVEMAVTKSTVDRTWFDDTVAGTLTSEYLSTLPINVSVEMGFALSSGNNNEVEIEVRNYRLALLGGFDVITTGKTNTNGGVLGTRAEPIPIKGFTRVELGDQIRVFIRNNSANTDVSTEIGGYFIIAKR